MYASLTGCSNYGNHIKNESLLGGHLMLTQNWIVGLVFNHWFVERIACSFLFSGVDDDSHDQSDEAGCAEVVEWTISIYVFVEKGSDNGLEEDAYNSEEGLDASQKSSRFSRGILIDKIKRSGEKSRHPQSQDNKWQKRDERSSLRREVDHSWPHSCKGKHDDHDLRSAVTSSFVVEAIHDAGQHDDKICDSTQHWWGFEGIFVDRVGSVLRITETVGPEHQIERKQDGVASCQEGSSITICDLWGFQWLLGNCVEFLHCFSLIGRSGIVVVSWFEAYESVAHSDHKNQSRNKPILNINLLILCDIVQKGKIDESWA